MPPDTRRGFSLSPQGRRAVRAVAVLAAVVGALLGLETLVLHLSTDPLNDVQAYYWAGQRLNAGLPLYPPDQSVETPLGYPYPPLLAILFRPLALLPFAAAAAIWEVGVIACVVLTVWRLGPRRRGTWLVLGMLSLPIVWCVVIGQAQVPMTLLITIGAPWSIALASNIKLFPAAIALWWIGRRDWRSLRRFVATLAVLALIQLLLAPQASLDYLTAISLKQVGEVRNFSPYVVSPVLWAVLVLAGITVVLRSARTRWGWAAAVTLSVVGNPRLLIYMLMSLVAVAATPEGSSGAGRDAA